METASRKELGSSLSYMFQAACPRPTLEYDLKVEKIPSGKPPISANFDKWQL